ncbi:hypothetical protein ACJJTC_014822 [Scirpophaga incertulas]
MAEFSGGGIPPDISTCDIGANEECLASVASYSSESSSLVSDSDVKSLGFSIKGEKRPRHKERRSKGKRSKVFIKDSSLSIPLGQQDPSSQDSSILLGQNQSTNSEQTELNSIINVISGSVADTQTTQQSHVLSDRQPIGRQNYCASDKGPFIVHIQKFVWFNNNFKQILTRVNPTTATGRTYTISHSETMAATKTLTSRLQFV